MGEKSPGSGTVVFLVLCESKAHRIGEWLVSLAEASLMPPVARVLIRSISNPTDGCAEADPNSSGSGGQQDEHPTKSSDRFSNSLLKTLNELQTCETNNGKPASVLVLVVALFWDGHCESSRTELAQLQRVAEKVNQKPRVLQGGAAGNVDGDRDNHTQLPDSNVHITIQALNARKSNERLVETHEAVVCSLRRKVKALFDTSLHFDPNSGDVAVKGSETQGNLATLHSGESDPGSKGVGSSGGGVSHDKVKPNSIGLEDISDAVIAKRVEDGQGESFVVISGQTMESLQQQVAELHACAKRIGVGCSPVLDEPREVQVNDGVSKKVFAQEFLVRQSSSLEEHIEMRLAMCGNVDSGKSTLTSVLTRGCRDDGRGFARAFVFKHKHEAATGRTSSVSENHLGFSETGEVVNYIIGDGRYCHLTSGPNESGGGTTNGVCKAATSISPHQLGQEIATRSSKVLTLYDLAGHERYLKTTVLGMTRSVPDYACIVISANNGIQRMTKEHVALCLALKIPFFVVLTRIDSTPENIRRETVTNIHKLLKIQTVRKLPYPVQRMDDVVLSAKNLRNDRITPIFEVSNVSGVGLQPLLRFLNLLPMRKNWRSARDLPREMVIDSTFFVAGVGTVVGGIVTQGIFHVNDTVLLGPDSSGAFRPVHIKSIHVKGIDQPRAVAGCDASFCLKKEKRRAIRKGNILTDPKHPAEAYWQFEADVVILYHSTTILVNYEPVIHSTTVRQSARIVYVEREVLRTGDRSLVRFHFLYRPEFMKVGQQLIFREGRTKGIGTVTKLIALREESLLMKRRKKLSE